MISVVDLIAFSIYLVSGLILIISNVKLRSKKTSLATKLLQTELEKQTILSMLEKTLDEKESNDIEKTEGFLKFVSDSRDWAFNYIEEVQAALNKFTKDVDADLKYILKYGQLIEHPLQDSITRIAVAYEELQKLLPQDKDQV